MRASLACQAAEIIELRRQLLASNRHQGISNESFHNNISPTDVHDTERMNSLRAIPARTARTSVSAHGSFKIINRRSFIHQHTAPKPRWDLPKPPLRISHRHLLLSPIPSPSPSAAFPSSRSYATKTTADETIEEIQEQYATARDEFEIATEETEKKSVYAADDRSAAREELVKLKELYAKALEGDDAEEVKRRVGQRIRELDNAVEALERSALED